MRPFCNIADNVARVAINIPIALESVGVTKVYAKSAACDWLRHRCNIPLLIAHEVHNCFQEQHKICSQGNKLCDIASECSKDLMR
jgi:hypothetical protein